MSRVDRKGPGGYLGFREQELMKEAGLRARLRELFTLSGLPIVASDPRIIVERRRRELDGANEEFFGRYTQPRTTVAAALQDLFGEYRVLPEQSVEISLVYGELYKPSEDKRHVR